VDQSPTETGTLPQGDLRAIESGLRSLWERAKRAGEVITELRVEKKALEAKVEQLESELLRIRQELEAREQQIASATVPAASFPDAERDILVRKAKELLVKLEAYL